MGKHLVEFKFDIDDKVIDQFDSMGIVEMCSKSNGGILMYSVVTSERTRWWNESELTFLNQPRENSEPRASKEKS